MKDFVLLTRHEGSPGESRNDFRGIPTEMRGFLCGISVFHQDPARRYTWPIYYSCLKSQPSKTSDWWRVPKCGRHPSLVCNTSKVKPKKMTIENWWIMNGERWVMDDGWWMMDDEWWMMDDEWRLMNEWRARNKNGYLIEVKPKVKWSKTANASALFSYLFKLFFLCIHSHQLGSYSLFFKRTQTTTATTTATTATTSSTSYWS